MTDTRKDFEEAIFEIAKSKDYQYMNTLFNRYENGDYKKTWVDMAWLGWNLNDKHIQQLLAVIAVKDKALKLMHKAFDDGDYKDGTESYAIQKCEDSLAIKPQDVELVEVGTVASQSTYLDEVLFSPDANTSRVEVGTKLYTIKQKA